MFNTGEWGERQLGDQEWLPLAVTESDWRVTLCNPVDARHVTLCKLVDARLWRAAFASLRSLPGVQHQGVPFSSPVHGLLRAVPPSLSMVYHRQCPLTSELSVVASCRDIDDRASPLTGVEHCGVEYPLFGPVSLPHCLWYTMGSVS